MSGLITDVSHDPCGDGCNMARKGGGGIVR